MFFASFFFSCLRLGLDEVFREITNNASCTASRLQVPWLLVYSLTDVFYT